MNNPAVMPQEKMELDLEMPNSLVQTDGHLRRSNSAPMINGLRSLFFHLDLCAHYIMSQLLILHFETFQFERPVLQVSMY